MIVVMIISLQIAVLGVVCSIALFIKSPSTDPTFLESVFLERAPARLPALLTRYLILMFWIGASFILFGISLLLAVRESRICYPKAERSTASFLNTAVYAFLATTCLSMVYSSLHNLEELLTSPRLSTDNALGMGDDEESHCGIERLRLATSESLYTRTNITVGQSEKANVPNAITEKDPCWA